MLVYALDGPEELINSRGFTGYFVSSQVCGYRLVELSATADALSNEQREHRVGIVVLQLTLLPFLNGPCGLAHVIHRLGCSRSNR